MPTPSQPLQGFRLSPQQRRVWRLQADSRAFRAQAALLLDGPLRPEALRDALEQVVRRHQILRTTFRRSPGIRFPIQVVREGSSLHWQTVDLADQPAGEQQRRLDELFRQAARRPFDLDQGPLVHASLVALGPGRHALLLGVPALCADRRSLDHLVRDLGTAYAGAADAGEAVQYVQFSEWQNELLEDEESRSGLDFWKGQDLSAVAGLKLPAGAGAGAGTGGGGAFAPEGVDVELGEEIASRLREREAHGGSPASLLLAAWLILLWRLGGREGAAGCGVVLDGREHEELRDAVGLFARCLPVSCPLSGEMTLSAAVAGLEASLEDARDYQGFAPEELEGLAAAFPALFEMAERSAAFRAGGVSFSPLRQTAFVERFQIALSAWRRDGSFGAEILHDTKAVSAGFAAGLAGRYRRLLGALLARPESAIGAAEILTEAERRQLLEEINRTAAELPGDCLHHLVARQAARTPEQTAVELAGRRLTYAELDAQANRLAHHLISEGVGPDRRVGLYLERSPEMLVALLAVLKAGGAYLPLDPAYPPERLAFMAADARLEIVLSQERLVEAMTIPRAKIFRLDADQAQWAGRPATDPAVRVTPGHLAYVIYTSGSTGAPKGVMVHHRGLVNYLSWAVAAYRIREGGSAPVHSPLGFDLTVTSLLAPLLAGGTVVLLPEERGVEALAEMLGGRARFSVLKLTPAHLSLLVQQLAEVGGVADTLVLGGEALTGESVAAWRERAPAARVINEYGPTETVVGCTVYEIPPGAGLQGAVPIGKPIANTEVYVLDPDLGPVPPGVPGELYVGGFGVARGYLGRPDLTAETFVPHPFSAEPGARLYRTGDQVRFLPDGDLEFLGRIDHQVKIRGYRIELGEIEAVLESHPAVRRAAAVAREDAPGDRRLVAYLVAAGDPAPHVDELRRFLAGKLPGYMIPGAFLLMSALPLTANGKVARALLPSPTAARPDLEKEYVPPRTRLEEELAAVWQQVLGIEKVGVHDSFFALGGDSIRSVRVVALLKEREIDITVDQLFRYQTVAEMAAQLGDASSREDAELARLVSELEGLSEEEVQLRLQKQLAEDRA